MYYRPREKLAKDHLRAKSIHSSMIRAIHLCPRRFRVSKRCHKTTLCQLESYSGSEEDEHPNKHFHLKETCAISHMIPRSYCYPRSGTYQQIVATHTSSSAQNIGITVATFSTPSRGSRRESNVVATGQRCPKTVSVQLRLIQYPREPTVCIRNIRIPRVCRESRVIPWRTSRPRPATRRGRNWKID